MKCLRTWMRGERDCCDVSADLQKHNNTACDYSLWLVDNITTDTQTYIGDSVDNERRFINPRIVRK